MSVVENELTAAERAQYEAVEGVIFDIQRYSLHDGPGLRTNVFCKGCPLRCGWCSNPESQRLQPEIAVFGVNCMRCGQFDEACPDLWQPGENGGGPAPLPDTEERVEACPARGVRWIGQRRSAGSIMADVYRDVPFYEANGGMTLTGGEPLMQPELAEALLRLAKAECINTAIETSGCVAWGNIERCLPYVDTVLMDLKHLDPQIHRRYTGVSNGLILDNLRRLAGLRVPAVVRVPLIPGFNTAPESMAGLAAFLRGLEPPLLRVDLLPYHTLGRAKYAALARAYPWEGHDKLTDEAVAEISEMLGGYGLAVSVGG
jgi:pyruvate formate lyase activating enzyme